MRFNPLPPSISTFARRQPSTMGLRTNAAGALVVRNLGSSLALKVMAVWLHGFIVATWWTSVRPRSVLFRVLFDAKVSEIVRTVLKFSGWFPSTSGIRRSSPILATCRCIQHALGLCVGAASSAPTHSLRACWILRQVAKIGEDLLIPEVEGNQHENFSSVLIVFETLASNNMRKRTLRSLTEVYQVATINPWSNPAITFDASDEPKIREAR